MMDLNSVSQAVKGTHFGSNPEILSVGTDSRTIDSGALFVALRGPRFDGHEFVQQAAERSANGALVDQRVPVRIPQVIVDDTELALGQLAGVWRRRFSLPVIAVTGSNAKTTVKEMIGAILSERAPTLVSQGNYNNTIGLPLSLLKITDSHEFAVVEIGMNQIGEIGYLTGLARPDISVITNAGAAHLEYLQSVRKVAIEKGRILRMFREGDIAVLNRDDPHFDYWADESDGRRIISFGMSESADVRVEYTQLDDGSDLRLHTPIGAFKVRLELMGVHNAANAAAAVAAALGAGAGQAEIIAGLEKMRPVAGRLQLRKHVGGGRLLDDTYNANPESVSAALNVLAGLSGDRRLIIGDMFELGPGAEQYHRNIGEQARKAGVGRLYCVGSLTKSAAAAFGRGADHYENPEDLVRDLTQQIDSNTIILVKGSRGMRMERIATALSEPRAEAVPC